MVDLDDLNYNGAKSSTAKPIRQSAYDDRIEVCKAFDELHFEKAERDRVSVLPTFTYHNIPSMAGLLFI